jgi:hypothetical protein
MNDNERIKQEIDETIGLLDRFDHPAVSDDLARRISRKMSQEYGRHRTRRLFLRIGSPLAAAAAIAIVGLAMFSGLFHSTPEPAPVTSVVQNNSETDTLLAEWVQQEQNAYGLFADLDFQTTRITTSQSAANNIDEEWNVMLLEAFDLDSSG